MPAPGGRFHCPDQSGYFDMSCALASELMSANALIKPSLSMVILRGQVTSLRVVLEIFQIRRCLALAHRHQEAVGADIIVILADLNVAVVLGAIVFEPDHVLG